MGCFTSDIETRAAKVTKKLRFSWQSITVQIYIKGNR